jgi:hypothetical protein
MKRIITLIFVTFLSIGFTYAQDSTILDQIYVGGKLAFSQKVYSYVSYPVEARQNGIIGLSMVSFKIDCNGNPYDFNFKNKLGNGIEESVQNAILHTAGSWKDCENRDLGQLVNLTFGYSINKLLNTETADFVLVAYDGVKIKTDKQLETEFEKYSKKGDYKKAKTAIEILANRYPNNLEYSEQKMKIEALIN